MAPAYKRWYDHDPLLLEVIELLKNYQTELRAQAEIFLHKIEEKVQNIDNCIQFIMLWQSLLMPIIVGMTKILSFQRP